MTVRSNKRKCFNLNVFYTLQGKNQGPRPWFSRAPSPNDIAPLGAVQSPTFWNSFRISVIIRMCTLILMDSRYNNEWCQTTSSTKFYIPPPSTTFLNLLRIYVIIRMCRRWLNNSVWIPFLVFYLQSPTFLNSFRIYVIIRMLCTLV